MKMVLFLLVSGAVVIVACLSLFDPQKRAALGRAGQVISTNAAQVSATLEQWDAEQIKEELARTGRIVRQKAEETGAKVADAAADAQITAAIKGKFAMDSDLSALSISVNTTRGVVTLSGLTTSHEHIRKAMRLALQPEGVHEVVSTLQVGTSAR